MKLSQYKEKKNHKKIIAIAFVIIGLIGGVIIDRTFANFKVQKSFKVMEGNFIYEGSGDVIFAFYQDDENVGTMPTKGSGYAFNAKKSYCDNDAAIKWDNNEWGPTIVDLSKTKTKCNLYFVKAGRLRTINESDTAGMWKYKYKLIKIVIETTKNKKEAGAGQIVYGPFNEGISGNTNAVQSYVVCDTGDTNCIGYLQGEGGIELNTNSSYLFYGFNKVTQIEGMENLYTSLVTNMRAMFINMSSLKELNLSNIYTRYVTDMSEMFGGMSSLEELDLKGFDTRNVTRMSDMFNGVRRLQKLDLSNFNTSKVTTMYRMFSNMGNLQTLNLSSFDTSRVSDMSSMFGGMSSLEELNLSNFDTSKVTTMEYMFADSRKLTQITYGLNFIHKSDATISNMFTNCPANRPDENVHSSWKGVYFD